MAQKGGPLLGRALLLDDALPLRTVLLARIALLLWGRLWCGSRPPVNTTTDTATPIATATPTPPPINQ
jgi:hypothetical protein